MSEEPDGIYRAFKAQRNTLEAQSRLLSEIYLVLNILLACVAFSITYDLVRRVTSE